MIAEQMDELKQHALRTFERDLPHMYTQRSGQWVAYWGDRQVGFADQRHLLYQQCFDQGLPPEEVGIFCIEAQETEITLGPVVFD